jgi:hypothetical protein
MPAIWQPPGSNLLFGLPLLTKLLEQAHQKVRRWSLIYFSRDSLLNFTASHGQPPYYELGDLAEDHQQAHNLSTIYFRVHTSTRRDFHIKSRGEHLCLKLRWISL